MPVVAAAQRLEALRQLGLSAPLCRLTAGEAPHPLLAKHCTVPPALPYAAHAACPAGPLLHPLWDGHHFVVGVWRRGDRLEFVRYRVETPQEVAVIATTEQGLWATLFVTLLEKEPGLTIDALRAPARAAGFRFLDELLDAYEEAQNRTLGEQDAFVVEIVERIDGWSKAPR